MLSQSLCNAMHYVVNGANEWIRNSEFGSNRLVIDTISFKNFKD